MRTVSLCSRHQDTRRIECHDPRHATPCVHDYYRPCTGCATECSPQYLWLPTVPKACHTCTRINVERELVLKTVDALLAAGHALATDEGDHRFYGAVDPTRDRDAIVAALMEVDDEHLGVFAGSQATGQARVCQPFAWVRFVYGNDGFDVISDYTTNLSAIVDPIVDYAGTLE